MSLPSSKPGKKFTYSDYLKWDDGLRWELIEGVPYLMSPAPNREHQRILVQLLTQLNVYLQDKNCEVYPAPFEVRLPAEDEKDEDIITVVQPDITVICDRDKLDDRGCKGAPDLIIEILSPATAKKDLHEKFDLYEKHKVKEYWTVFPLDKVIDIYQLNDNGKYEKTGTYFKNDQIPVSLFADFSIELRRVFS